MKGMVSERLFEKEDLPSLFSNIPELLAYHSDLLRVQLSLKMKIDCLHPMAGLGNGSFKDTSNCVGWLWRSFLVKDGFIRGKKTLVIVVFSHVTFRF